MRGYEKPHAEGSGLTPYDHGFLSALKVTEPPPLVVVCGSRAWAWPDPIRDHLAALPAGTRVLHGGAPGADRLAGRLARALGLEVETMPAEWARYGRRAGHLRNARMLDRLPEHVYAYNLGTPGTAGMAAEARRRGIPLTETGRDGCLWIATRRAAFGLEVRDWQVTSAPPYARKWALGRTLAGILAELPATARTAWIEGAAPAEARAVHW